MNLTELFRPLPRFMRRHKLARLLLALAPESKIQRVNFNGSARLYADISDPFPRSYFLTRSFEPEFFSIAVPFLKNGGTYFDVGANFGFNAFGLMPHLPEKVKYHLFEANSEMVQCLKKSTELHPGESIAINACAVTDKPGMSKLYLKPGHLGGSYLSGQGTRDIPNLRLDDYISSCRISRIDFMKVDIEGSELGAFRGAEESLREGIVKVIYFEISTETLSRFDATPDECFDFLRSCGFELFHIKAVDFAKGIARTSETRTLLINGEKIRLCPLHSMPADHETDVLAIHKSTAFLRDFA